MDLVSVDGYKIGAKQKKDEGEFHIRDDDTEQNFHGIVISFCFI
jgi:hypothetical protein